MASSSFFPTNNHAALTDIADSLSAYLDSNAQSESLPAFDFDHLSEVMMQITADMQRAQMHANAYEEAASSARMKASRLRSILNSCKNLSTPLVRMPSEVLAIIFEHCIQVDTAAHVFSPHAMPWVLSQTCRKWRSTVLSMPSLWTVVRVNTRIMGFLRHRKSLLPLQIWLSRSYPLPISCLAILDDPKTGVFNADVLELLVHHSTRWYAVHITLGAQCDLYHQLCCADLHLPSLHSVFLKAHISSHPDGARMHVSTVWEAPNLTDATLLVESESADLSPAIVPRWSQLEELAWSSNTSKAFLDVASTFVNLRYCTLDIIHDVDTQDIHRAALPRLRHLETFGSFRSTLLILNHLSLPSLEYLDLDFDECIDSVADHILISLGRLQARSRCNLRHLSAPFSLFSSPNTPVLVEKIGTVEGLRVILSVEEDSEQAILNFARSKIFRKLRTLHLLFREMPDDDLPLFSDVVGLVETRYRTELTDTSICRLERLSLDVMTASAEPESRLSAHLQPFQWLLRLQSDGLTLLGQVVDGKWRSKYGAAHWYADDLERVKRRWARFGCCDWLLKPEIIDLVQGDAP